MTDADEPNLYDVILTEPAEMEIESAYFQRMRFGLQNADNWYAGLSRAIESLDTFPRRFTIAPDSDILGGNVRQMLYGTGRNAYRILYRVIEPQGDNAGIVRILRLRHTSRRRLDEIEES